MILQKYRKKVFSPLGHIQQQSLLGVPLASFSRRAAAFMIDFGMVVFIIILFSLPEVLRSQAATGDINLNIDPFHGWELITLPVYFGIWTYFGHGQTIGKKLLRIRVVSIVHDHLTLWHSIERSLGYGASFLEGGFGFFQYYIHPNGQTVHDKIAETIVIKVKTVRNSKNLKYDFLSMFKKRTYQ